MASIDNGPAKGSWIPAGQETPFHYHTGHNRYGRLPLLQFEWRNGTNISRFATPNPADTAFFDLSEAILGRLEVDAFKFGQTGTIHSLNNKMYSRSNGNIKRYRLKVGHFDGSSETLAEDISSYYYLFDGYEQLSQGLLPSFSDYTVRLNKGSCGSRAIDA